MTDLDFWLIGFLIMLILLWCGFVCFVKWQEKEELKWYLKMRMLDHNMLYEDIERKVRDKE